MNYAISFINWVNVFIGDSRRAGHHKGRPQGIAPTVTSVVLSGFVVCCVRQEPGRVGYIWSKVNNFNPGMVLIFIFVPPPPACSSGSGGIGGSGPGALRPCSCSRLQGPWLF